MAKELQIRIEGRKVELYMDGVQLHQVVDFKLLREPDKLPRLTVTMEVDTVIVEGVETVGVPPTPPPPPPASWASPPADWARVTY